MCQEYMGGNGKENGNYYSIYRGYVRIMEKKMETTIWGSLHTLVWSFPLKPATQERLFGNTSHCSTVGSSLISLVGVAAIGPSTFRGSTADCTKELGLGFRD